MDNVKLTNNLEDVKETVTPAPAETKAEEARCRKCGWMLSATVIEPTEADTIDFLKSVLSGDAFVKTYSVFNDNLKITLRTRTVKETDSILQQIELDRVAGKFNVNPMLMFSVMNRYQLAISLQEISGPDKKIYTAQPTTELNVSIADADAKLRAAFNESLFAVLLNTQRDFEALVGTLTARANDPSFWKTAG